MEQLAVAQEQPTGKFIQRKHPLSGADSYHTHRPCCTAVLKGIEDAKVRGKKSDELQVAVLTGTMQ